MRVMSWILFFAAIGVAVYAIRLIRGRIEQQRRASAERAASLLAQVAAPALKPAASAVPQPRVDPAERLLLDAATKAAEAGEPALSIQLYTRLLERYPQSVFATQARSEAERLARV